MSSFRPPFPFSPAPRDLATPVGFPFGCVLVDQAFLAASIVETRAPIPYADLPSARLGLISSGLLPLSLPGKDEKPSLVFRVCWVPT